MPMPMPMPMPMVATSKRPVVILSGWDRRRQVPLVTMVTMVTMVVVVHAVGGWGFRAQQVRRLIRRRGQHRLNRQQRGQHRLGLTGVWAHLHLAPWRWCWTRRPGW